MCRPVEANGGREGTHALAVRQAHDGRVLSLSKGALGVLCVCLLVPLEAGAAGLSSPKSDVRYTNVTNLTLEYDLDEDAGDVARAELWVTQDGGASWRLERLDDDLRSPVRFKAERDGQYGFYVVLTDRAGNRSLPEGEPSGGRTRSQLTLVVDTRAPKVEILGPRGGPFGRARGVRVAWRASDEYLAASPVTIDYTTDDGRTWEQIASGLDAAGSHVWQPPPGGAPPRSSPEDRQRGVRRYRFRVTAIDRAGNLKSVAAIDDVLLDDEPPVVRAAGPSSLSRGAPVRAREGEVEVAYEASDRGASGLESVRLYVTSDGGRTWREAAVDEDGESPLIWTLSGEHDWRPGKYGLYLVGTDRAGNVGRIPSRGTKPQLLREVGAVGLVVRLGTFNTGGCYRGEGSYEIRWRASGQGLGATPVRLEYSLDGGGSWIEIARDRPASGVHAWKLPRADTERAMVRVRATGSAGVSGEAVSRRPFVIDSTPPRASLRFDPGAQEDTAALASREAPPPVESAAGADAGVVSQGVTEGDAGEENAAGPVALPVRKPPEVTPEPVRRAREHLAAERCDEAVSILQEFVAREPHSPEANVLLGEARARQTQELANSGGVAPHDLLRRYDEAAAALRAALRTDQDTTVRLRGRGRFWLGMCHFYRARLFYRQLRRKDEAMAEAALAADEFGLSLGMRPNTADQLYYAGMAHYMLAMAGPEKGRRGHTRRAEELFEKTLVPSTGRPSDTTAGSAHWYLALLAERSRNRPKGIEHARKALEIFGPESSYAPRIRDMIRKMGGR